VDLKLFEREALKKAAEVLKTGRDCLYSDIFDALSELSSSGTITFSEVNLVWDGLEKNHLVETRHGAGFGRSGYAITAITDAGNRILSQDAR